MIRYVLVGEVYGDVLTGGEFEVMVSDFKDGWLFYGVVEKEAGVFEILPRDEYLMRLSCGDRGRRLDRLG